MNKSLKLLQQASDPTNKDSTEATVSFGSEEIEEDTMQVSTEILIMLFLLMLSIMGGHFLKKREHKYLQESGLTTLIGIIAGLVLKFMSIDAYMTNLSNHFVTLFMILLLPPIILESGYNMQKKPFFKNIGTIIMFAFLGTCIAIFSSSIMFYIFGLTPLTPSFTIQESLAFGSLISSTDPVAVLAIFKEMDADINLYTIIFGESIFNDAISIVMYNTVAQATDQDSDYQKEIRESVSQFFIVFFGSIFIGMFSALLISFILKRQSSFHRDEFEHGAGDRVQSFYKKQNHNTEIAMMILCPWVSYLIAEGLELSGIVAIMVNGIFLSYYATPNISSSSKKVLKTGYETIAYSAEILVFIFLGLGLFAFDHPYKEMGVWMVLLTLINLTVSRFLNIWIISWIVNKFRTDNKITPKYKLVMLISGLRGAMAYALALKSSIEFQNGKIILIVTLLYSIFSILIVGSFLNPIFEKYDVKNKAIDHVAESEERDRRPKNCCLRLKQALKRFDTYYFSPLFIKDQKDIDKRNKEESKLVEGEETWTQDDLSDSIRVVPNKRKSSKRDEFHN